jgi:hypothetical protein
MNSKDFSRLSIGITYRFDLKKALFSQIGALAALVITIISEGHPPFGDEPYRLMSGTTILFLVNLMILLYTIITAGASSIKLFPSMLIYMSKGNPTRIDFSRVVRVVIIENKLLNFVITDTYGKEAVGLKIKNYGAYHNSRELIGFLAYLLGDKIVKNEAIAYGKKKPKRFDIGSGDHYRG